MSYVLWCPVHKKVVETSYFGDRSTLGTGMTHRVAENCLTDFEIKEVLP